jgi:uncharacterized protein YbbC (DUF1343 family)
VICGGGFIHVTDRDAFESVLTTMAILGQIRRLYGDKFEWLEPPYEYEYDLLPIDILAGGTGVREMVDRVAAVSEMREWIRSSSNNLRSGTRHSYLYL